MAIIVNLDVMMARRKIGVTELAEKVGITMANLSILKNGKAKAVRFSTLERLCDVLNCQPGDLLEFDPDKLIDESVDDDPEESQRR
jgi:putative transcriptional regulator